MPITSELLSPSISNLEQKRRDFQDNLKIGWG